MVTTDATNAAKAPLDPDFRFSPVGPSYGEATVKETTLESLPLQVDDEVVVVVPPIVLVDEPPVGGLSTRICSVPGCAISEAGMVATN